MTVEDVANYLDVPVKTVYAWNSNGSGPKRIRVGKYVRYRQSELEEWLKTCTTT